MLMMLMMMGEKKEKKEKEKEKEEEKEKEDMFKWARHYSYLQLKTICAFAVSSLCVQD